MAFIKRIIKRVFKFNSDKFKEKGSNVVVSKDSFFSYNNISLGNDIYIGPRANFICKRKNLTIFL